MPIIRISCNLSKGLSSLRKAKIDILHRVSRKPRVVIYNVHYHVKAKTMSYAHNCNFKGNKIKRGGT